MKDFKKAIDAAPECEGDEVPRTDESVKDCSPSCRRAESGYKLKDIIDCLTQRSECDEGVDPFTLPGGKCAVCERPRRKCTKECAEGEKCIVRMKNETMKRMKCVKKTKLRLKFKAKGLKATLMKLKSLDKPGAVKAILEMLARYCERNSEAKRCKKWLSVIRETLECKKKKDSDDEVEIELEVASESDEWTEETTGRRLLAEDDVGKLLTDAAMDDETLEVAAGEGGEGGGGEDSGAVSGNLISSMIIFMSMILFSI